MVKIYIDTNIFIGFYQSSNNPINILDEIAKYSQYLVTTSQTINEFHRNRIGVLNKLIKNFQDSVKFNPFCTSLIRDLPEFDDLTTKCREVREKSQLVIQKLETAKKRNEDPVAQKFDAIFNHPSTTNIVLTDVLINKAYQRKLLGNPPTSDGKITIGDEVIWESLLSRVREDLIIVAQDKTYVDNLEVLASEFQSITNKKLLLVTEKVYEALRRLGEIPPPRLVEEEDRIDNEEKCPKCGARGEICGFEGSDGDEAAWFECNACGHIEMFR
ncbi:DUF4935 domain-containing protein [Leptolyngbya sp. FACHB-671]|uniref:PIN domain-containing protein n=1 Tax=Leptolyngbya sp. FACHB-671 TaxID=2692812 RepID=UPI001686694F|nr:PIN domain-containing protein [Leptolyngbya sp. FACHB-671]MBD2071878.1 DUF4935 domain-containing protein [Leptolyngbya sp. FACHB-671]